MKQKRPSDYGGSFFAMNLQRNCNVTRAVLLYYQGKEKNEMTNQNTTPATKSQLDGLIRTCLEAGYNDEAGLLQLASDSISEKVKQSDQEKPCICFEVMGDNKDCPKHGDLFENHGSYFHRDDYKSDYQERNDLYNMGMGR